jgi:Domain of unknown function (DUF4345)
MKTSVLPTVLKVLAPIILMVSVLHLALGAGADVLLGAKLSPEALADPALNSQNRFYGVTFGLYGVVLYLCATDLPKYAAVLRCLLWVFFTGGIARLVSIATHGVPPPLVLVLLVTELVVPALLLAWLSKVLREA